MSEALLDDLLEKNKDVLLTLGITGAADEHIATALLIAILKLNDRMVALEQKGRAIV